MADLCAGAINHFYKCHVVGLSDELSRAVEDLGCLDWGDNFVLPQPYATPEELGTAGTNGTSGVDEMVAYLGTKRSNS